MLCFLKSKGSDLHFQIGLLKWWDIGWNLVSQFQSYLASMKRYGKILEKCINNLTRLSSNLEFLLIIWGEKCNNQKKKKLYPDDNGRMRPFNCIVAGTRSVFTLTSPSLLGLISTSIACPACWFVSPCLAWFALPLFDHFCDLFLSSLVILLLPQIFF